MGRTFRLRSRTAAVLAVVAAIIVLGGVSLAWSPWDRFFRQPTILEQEVASLEERLQRNPDDPDLKVQLSLAYVRQERYADAEHQLREILDENADNQSALSALGRLYLNQGKFAEAVAPFTRVVELNEDNPMKGVSRELEGVYYSLGLAYLNLHQPEEAVSNLKQALLIDRTDSDAHYLVGLGYQQQGNHEEAIEALLEAVRFVPNYREAYQALAQSYEARGLAAEADYALSMASFSSGDYEDALSKLRTVVVALPDFAPAHLGLGLTYEKLGQKDEAVEAYSRVLQIDPHS
jgi:tetratricopeptide (TPR) repeat protein